MKPQAGGVKQRRRCAAAAVGAVCLLVGAATAAPPVLPARPLSSRDSAAAAADNSSVEAAVRTWRSGGAGVQVVDSLLAERVLAIRSSAPSFDRAWRELEESGVPVLIGTREEINDYLPRYVRDSNGWAGITVSWGDSGGALERSAVAIRVELVRSLNERYGNADSVFLAQVDELLIHEVYGHLVPVVAHGSATYTCADPGPKERLADSCVGQRQMALEAERRTVMARMAGRGPE